VTQIGAKPSSKCPAGMSLQAFLSRALPLPQAKPIGVMQMLDQGERDDKLIAVHADDPEFKGFTDISQLPPHRLAEIKRCDSFAMCLVRELKLPSFSNPTTCSCAAGSLRITRRTSTRRSKWTTSWAQRRPRRSSRTPSTSIKTTTVRAACGSASWFIRRGFAAKCTCTADEPCDSLAKCWLAVLTARIRLSARNPPAVPRKLRNVYE
jgi:hypothetical protein